MSYPRFNNFILQDGNYITSEIEYRTSPSRSLDYERLARRPGVKLFGTEFAERKVRLQGYIVANGISDLREKIDQLHKEVTRPETGLLQIESDRYANATVVSLGIADPHYSQDFVPFELEFLLADPFFYGNQLIIALPVTSGTTSLTISTVISGTAFAEPLVTYSAPAGVGITTTSAITIEYGSTGERLTWSGTGPAALEYGSTVGFDYLNQLITKDTAEVDIDGVFAQWEPGTTSITTTFSGRALGGSLNISYNVRYF